jgi:uncharacterized membrane protein YgdD (TMEM256/DUF423 family)
MSPWVAAGAISGFLAVALGAFGAHGLADQIDARALAAFETGARYQMYHALALLAVGVLAARDPSRAFKVAGWAFVAGSLIFSGSLYMLAVSGQRWLGAITPVGGISFMTGWIALAYAAVSGAKARR